MVVCIGEDNKDKEVTQEITRRLNTKSRKLTERETKARLAE